MDTAGDGFFASFDGPARAIRCACAIQDASRLGLELRAGLHPGECEAARQQGGGRRGRHRRAVAAIGGARATCWSRHGA